MNIKTDQTVTDKVPMINFTIDGRPVSVAKGTTVYQATKQIGIDIPIFCYQDRMPPFGACRVCLVEVEKSPKLQTSCTLEATEGMVVKTSSDKAVKERENILEFLLINHPLDCPICDKGGECPLQDQVLKFGPGISRFYEEKRHFKKPIPLGPVLMLDRERCIICARCTRFSDEVSGDHALEFIDRGFRTEVGTPGGGPVDSKFIGNTISICPVGALTSQVYRFRARPWDNQHIPSTCTLCPVGCSMTLDERDGDIMRTRALEDKNVNDIWMCDKGWFGYEFVDSGERLNSPLIRKDGQLVPATFDEAINYIASKMQNAKSSGLIAGLGGNQLTVEENFLFQKLIRDYSGSNHVDHRVGMPIFSIDEEGIPAGMSKNISECESLDFAVLFGLDITEEFPVIWLRLKKAINHGAKVIFLGNFAPEVSKHFDQTILHAPGKEMETLRQHLPHLLNLLSVAKKGAFFVGSQYLNVQNRAQILSELENSLHNVSNASLNILEGSGNSFGARFAGMRPDVLPFGKQVDKTGYDAIQILEIAAKSGWEFLLVAGANPAVKLPKLWKAARPNLKCLVVQDIFLNETAMQADVVLPTLSYVEKSGSFINIEGRIRKLKPGKVIPAETYSDGDIFLKIAHKLGLPLSLSPEFIESLTLELIPPFKQKPKNANAKNIAPSQEPKDGSLSASFAKVLFDQGVRMKHNAHLSKLSKQAFVRIHPLEAVKRGIKEGESLKLKVNENQILAKVKIDLAVSVGTIVLPLGFSDVPVHELGNRLFNGLIVEVKQEP